MHVEKYVSTPIAPHFKFSALQCPSTDEDIEYMSRVPYCTDIGSLMSAMVCSRLIYHMICVWLVDTWLILVKNIKICLVDFHVPSWHIQSLLKV
jgi:hypothetical protein